MSELEAHLTQAPMRPTTMDVDLETKQASLILTHSQHRYLPPIRHG